jgi:hypothetical protein
MRKLRRRWQLDSPFALIQQIRLVHAVAESSFEIAVPADQLDKFSVLRERFGLDLAVVRPDDPSLTPFVTIDHKTPSTALGVIVRPLIFPRAIVDHRCTLWPAARPHRLFVRRPALTENRRALLERWMAAC